MSEIVFAIVNSITLFYRGVCTQSPVYCIIMEFCPYGTLQNILKTEEFLPPTRLVSWAKQIASGMQYLHGHRIIHRDLKSPKYVLLLSMINLQKIFKNCLNFQYFDRQE